jgi:hypothetical protein
MLQFTMNRGPNADGTSLRKLLEAHRVYARIGAAKRFSLHLLALVGVVVWIGAMWPSLLPAPVRLPALALWGGLLFLAVLASVEERTWRRKLERLARHLREHPADQGRDA